MEENESRIEEYYEYEASIPEIPLFEKVADDVNFSRFTYYRELRTDILYLECWTGQTVIFTPVIGLDGLPLTYTAWIEMEDNYG